MFGSRDTVFEFDDYRSAGVHKLIVGGVYWNVI